MILASDHMIIILIVFFALVIGMCASIIVSCWGKIKERRQRELEYKLRRSRDTSMEAGLDRSMTVNSLDKQIVVVAEYSPTTLAQHHFTMFTADPFAQEEDIFNESTDSSNGSESPIPPPPPPPQRTKIN